MLESLSVRLFTAEKMRATDAAAIEGLGIPGGHLMERAGVAVARELMLAFEPESVVIYAGKGNNGGDGFVVARELFNAGVDVTVHAIAGREYNQGWKQEIEAGRGPTRILCRCPLLSSCT